METVEKSVVRPSHRNEARRRGYNVSISRYPKDYILSISALIQPVLVLLQLFMIDALYVDYDLANKFRILAAAIPVLVSMVIVIQREFSLTVLTYSIVLTILFFTVILFPGRWAFMKDDVIKFTLTVVIPIGLSIASIKNFAVFMRCVVYVSIAAVAIGFVYAVLYLMGAFILETYSMTFSYALLFPTFVLLTKKKMVWKLLAVVMMLEMLAIGSRGAFLMSVLYMAFLFIMNNRSHLSVIIIVSLFLAVIGLLFFDDILNLLVNIFKMLGINSRTLEMISEDELLTHDSGRGDIWANTWELIKQRPLFGSGVWADRQAFDIFCHNVILELLVDFGFVGTILVLGFLIVKQLNIYLRIPKNHKVLYIMFFAPCLSLMVSGSYLTSFNVGLYLGFSYLLSKLRDKRRYQKYRYI